MDSEDDLFPGDQEPAGDGLVALPDLYAAAHKWSVEVNIPRLKKALESQPPIQFADLSLVEYLKNA